MLRISIRGFCLDVKRHIYNVEESYCEKGEMDFLNESRLIVTGVDLMI